MAKIYSTVACNLDTNIILANLPLLEKEKIQALEWSFDTLYKHKSIPDWFIQLLKAFGNNGRLIGHGVYYSLFSGRWTKEQQEWLLRLKRMSAEFHFDHITEHFGFMTGEDFHKGAPLSIPLTNNTLQLGIDRIKRIQDACNCPVGLENLAFSYAASEASRQGEFLETLLEKVNGFLILDLHNLYCQIHNFDLDFDEAISQYPLKRVREIHISGGSWMLVTGNTLKTVRRDTHDNQVPDIIFSYLEKAIDICPNLKYVVLEQIGTGLATDENRKCYQQDFLKMDKLIKARNTNVHVPIESFLPFENLELSPLPITDNMLYVQQKELSHILENAITLSDAKKMLTKSGLAGSEWQIEQWQDPMIETALSIAQKWKNGHDR